MKDLTNDINLIKQMISESQGTALSIKKHFLLWGITIPLTTVIMNLFVINNLESWISNLWPFSCGVSALLSIIIGMKSSPRHKTVFIQLYKMVWISVLISITIVLVFIILGTIPLNIALAFISILVGLGSLISGYMQKSRMIKIVSIIWYLLAVVLLLNNSEVASYIIGYTSFFLLFIPGIMLKEKNV